MILEIVFEIDAILELTIVDDRRTNQGICKWIHNFDFYDYDLKIWCLKRGSGTLK